MSFAIWWSRNKAPFLWLVLIVAVTGVIRSSIQDTFTPALTFLRVTLACVAVAMSVKLFFHYKRLDRTGMFIESYEQFRVPEEQLRKVRLDFAVH